MKKLTLLLCCFLLLAYSCKKEEHNNYASEKQQVKETYANIAFAVYDDSYLGAIELEDAIQDFLNNPTPTSFEAAKQAWLDVREIYGLTETFRFADGPIDNPADGPEGLINAWPMDEAHVDYVAGNPDAGIINDSVSYPIIDEATLLNANENPGEENISLGFHAIEFLLWGQDLSDATAGQRPYTDYLTTGGTAANQQRRSVYLRKAAEILKAGLKQVRDAWDPAISGNYRSDFLAFTDSSALRRMFNSMKVLAGFELAGERIYTAYENMDQEDEHSCFSDNTHRDIFLNAKGIENLYKGFYTRSSGITVSGFALKDLVALYDADKNEALISAFSATETAISAMYIPFDQAIIIPDERPKVLVAVQTLQAEETKIREAAAACGVDLP